MSFHCYSYPFDRNSSRSASTTWETKALRPSNERDVSRPLLRARTVLIDGQDRDGVNSQAILHARAIPCPRVLSLLLAL